MISATVRTDFALVLSQYQQRIKLTAVESFRKKVQDVSFSLFSEFGPPFQAESNKIPAAASNRGFTMGRRGDSLTPSVDGVSFSAWNAARRMLGGLLSGLFKIQFGEDGDPRIRAARFGARSGKLLKGGRNGNRFARSAKRLDELTAEQKQSALQAGGFVRLNLRALATALEIRRRTSAAKGGTMRVQWLPRQWRRRQVVRKGGLEVRNKTGALLGKVDVRDESILISGAVPGTEHYPGRVNNAVRFVTNDMAKYLTDRQIEVARAAGVKP